MRGHAGGTTRAQQPNPSYNARILGRAARHRPTEPGPSAQHSGLCLRGLEAPEGGRLLPISVHGKTIAWGKNPRGGNEIHSGAEKHKR